MDKLNRLFEDADIRNFGPDELIKSSIPPESLYENIIPTLTLLQSIRDHIGRPIKINSCYRDEAHNRAVGGKKNSLHLLFNAIDFKPVAFSSKEISELAESIDNNRFAVMTKWRGKLITLTPELLGVGLYDNFIHIDTRGLLDLKAPVRWFG